MQRSKIQEIRRANMNSIISEQAPSANRVRGIGIFALTCLPLTILAHLIECYGLAVLLFFSDIGLFLYWASIRFPTLVKIELIDGFVIISKNQTTLWKGALKNIIKSEVQRYRGMNLLVFYLSDGDSYSVSFTRFNHIQLSEIESWIQVPPRNSGQST